MPDYIAARTNMVKSQIRPNKVTDPLIIEAMGDIPRERFVPESHLGVAYIDEDIAIAGGRYLMEPMVLARLLQSAEIKETDVVLDIGCATGYSAALIARLANTVVALESDPDLAATAQRLLSELDVDNAVVIDGDRILNEGGLRFANEFVRHKVLDMIGDLYLVGGPVIGHAHCVHGGHGLTLRLLKALFAQPDAWCWTEATEGRSYSGPGAEPEVEPRPLAVNA